jgi:hypothetical protein
MPGAGRRCAIALLVAALVLAPTASRTAQLDLGPSRSVAPGVALYHVTDPAHLTPPAPLSAWLLRVDPAAVDLRAALANDEIVDTETVAETASRHRALAAVNAGFFVLPTGDPAGLYKINGQLVSETRRPRGAVGILRDGSGSRLIFDRVTGSITLRIRRRRRPDARVPIAGIDTPRQAARLMLFTPAWHAHTDTAPDGLEWVLRDKPLRVAAEPNSAGKTPIPRDGFVLSYGGPRAPAPLTQLRLGTEVDLESHYTAVDGPPGEWVSAEAIVGGAGLLIRGGRLITDWSMERLSAGFAETRHPRTLIGTHPDGSVWLVTVDGRQPKLSAGMSLFELRDFARRLGLTNALNLDGGGSTTMWVDGRIVNSPSDAAGPRKVSDSLLVIRR